MAGLVAVVALVGVLTVLNLLLTIGVIRRLREHTELIAEHGSGRHRDGTPSLPVGRRVADFSGSTIDGIPVSRDLLAAETVVAFLTPGCHPCRASLPQLVETLADWPGGQAASLIVIVGTQEKASDYISTLGPVARIVVEEVGGPIADAFGAEAYPLFGTVDSTGEVLRSELDPAALRLPLSTAV